ncbi:MAG: chorismate mutase / prephenate dehydratase [Blastocatellia bacterium]|jgi:prephenate dehydratase/chorismate mutase|nr:chorismate mutase / prephenate dehydratase [Blastocatellia bacterium]
MSIDDWRSRINELDGELLRLLNERARIALKVGESKKEAGVALCDHTREREVVERMCEANEGPLDERAIVELYRAIIHESRRIQNLAMQPSEESAPHHSGQGNGSLRVAFQGARGAFSEEAAVKLLGKDITLVPRTNFESLFNAIDDKAADCILAPIENSLAGFVHACYDLLLESKLYVSGEVIIPINHYLIGCAGASFEGITAVESHPVALDQCRRFLAANPQISRIAAEDTAGSVARIVAQGDPSRAAIAGKRAGEEYGGVVLREHLEDSSENYTRFLLLTTSEKSSGETDKISLVIELPHQPGALHNALEPFARRGIDLLKIQGRPVKGRPWEYCFYLDLRGSPNDSEVAAALSELRDHRVETRVLGAYRAAVVPSG